jgi:hypothetical protein
LILSVVSQPSNWKRIGAGLDLYEPSGITYLHDRDRFLIVDDEGYICTMTRLGHNLSCVRARDRNGWEDVTMVRSVYDRRQDKPVYILEEVPPTIVEWNTISHVPMRRWDLSADLPHSTDTGGEGLAWVIDPQAAEGGYFYVGNQYDGRIYVFELKVSTSNSSTKLTLVDDFTPMIDGHTDIAGLFYYPFNKKLYICIDKAAELYETDINGKNPRNWHLMDNQFEEGVFIMGNSDYSTIYVADDAGAVWVGDIDLSPGRSNVSGILSR